MGSFLPGQAARQIQIGYLDEGDDGRSWDAYVEARTGTVTDLFAWRRVVRDAYGIRSYFLTATDESRIVGTLGLYEIKHPIFGHYLTTAVFGNDGGLHFDSPEARDSLVAEARKLANDLDVAYLVIRTRDLDLDEFQIDRNYYGAVLDLTERADELWKQLPGKTRNQVRRGEKEGFTLKSGAEQAGAFFDVFHTHMRDLGSPAHSRKYYEAIAEHLGDRAEYLVVTDGAKLVAGALLFRVNGSAMNYHTVSLRQYNRRCPNYLLYWRMIEASASNGLRWFDMGRSRAGSSQLQFKSNWNPQEVPLHYNFFLRKSENIPDLDPRNAKYRVAISLWQKMPLFVTKSVGPRLITGLA